MEFNARDAYDALVSARSAPAGEAAGVDVVQLARDVVLAEQEFRRAGEYFSGERARAEAREQGLGDWAKGLGWGVLAAASVTPWGSLGRLGRAARLGQDVFGASRAVGAGKFARAEGPVNRERLLARALEEPIGEAAPILRGRSLSEYPDTFEPVDFPILGNIYSRHTTQLYQWPDLRGALGPVEERVTGPRASGLVLDSDFLNGRERFFHGTPAGENVDKIISEGLKQSGRGSYGAGLYGTSSLSEAVNYGVRRMGLGHPDWSPEASREAARAAREDLRYVFEFVTDRADVNDVTRVTSVRPEGVGYARILSDVPAERIAAVHVFEPTGGGNFRLVDSRVLNREFGSALEDYGVLPRVEAGWDIPEGVDSLTREVLEFQREAGVPFGEALAAVNRTRAAEGLEPVGDVARGAGEMAPSREAIERVGSGLPAGRVSGEVDDVVLEGQPGQGGSVLGAVLSPATAPQQFGAVSAEGAQRIFDVMAERGPLKVVSPEDLRTPGMIAWLDSLGDRLRSGSVSFSGDYPEFTQFQPFAEALGLNRARLLSGQRGQTFRPMMQAIAEGRYDEVLDDLAGQVNNVFTLLDDDVFRLAFYPFMSNSTFAAARASGTDVTLLSAVAGVASAGSNPIQEARLVGDLFEWAGKNIQVARGSLVVPSRGDVPGMLKTPATAYAQLVNNPDWLSNQVPGLASKTYVYAMLKLNPEMARALVIDRVDASARFAAFELDAKRFPKGWSWATEGAKATEGVELALGGFAARVVAAALDVPPAAVQENVWALWRVLRDLQVGGGTSRVSSVRNRAGETMEQILSRAKMPAAHRRILERNMEALRAEVSGGGPAARYWQFSDEGVLIPRTDMPIDGYLPPAIRTPENVEALTEAVGNADRIGRGLREKRPWAPIAMVLSLMAFPSIRNEANNSASQPASIERYI